MSLTNWKVNTQIKGKPTHNIRPFCHPTREAVQIASGSFILHDVAMIELNCSVRCVEQRDVHYVQIVKVSKKFVTIFPRRVDISREFRGS